jgi:hypothetical protein
LIAWIISLVNLAINIQMEKSSSYCYFLFLSIFHFGMHLFK